MSVSFITVILMAIFSSALTQQQFSNSLDRWSFIVTPMYNSRLPSPIPWLLPSQPAVARRDDYTYTSGIAGYKLHTRAVVWNEARLTCEEEGGHLAIINSVAEANAITELFKNSAAITGSPHPDFVSLGFHDLYSEGHFVTIHGQSLAKAGFDQWLVGQPDSGAAENCGSLHKNGKLNDISCSVNLGFVCEMQMF